MEMHELVYKDIWKIQFVVWIRTKEVQKFIWELNYSIYYLWKVHQGVHMVWFQLDLLNLETSTLSPKLNGQAPGSRLSELGLDFPRELNCVWDIDIADP